MQWLASYVMRGRRQALLVAVLSAGVPMFFWVSAAVLGLVTLRKGIREGLLLLMWASLPAAAMVWLGEIVPLCTLVGVTLLAALLRATESWQLALLGATGLGLLLSIGLVVLGGSYIASIQAIFAEFFAELQRQAASQGVEFVSPDEVAISGMFGLVLAVALIMSLLIARWWQALLYNPGGLRTEFHALRLQPLPAILLLLLTGLFAFVFERMQFWIWIPMLPVFFAGLGLMHGLIARRGLGNQWLVLMYVGLAIMPAVKEGLMVLAVADSWIDFRHRLGNTEER